MISRARVLELLSYDQHTGVFTRLKSRAHWVGKPAGKIDSQGHRQILLDRHVYAAHRLAWFVMTGSWPVNEIDHKDGNPDHNAWNNLRSATRSQNMQNVSRPRGKTGFKGICRERWKKDFRWKVSVSKDGDRHVAYFRCFGQAFKHAAKTRVELHGTFANHGIRV